MNVYLVIDIGTSSMRGILYDRYNSEIDRITFKTLPDYNGEIVEQSVESWDKGLGEILNFCFNYIKLKSLELSGIMLTAQRSSLICLDREGKPLMNAIMWQDKRTNNLLSEFESFEDDFIERTGAKLNPVYLGLKIYFVKKNHPDIYNNTFKFLSIADYIRYKLTGNFITDYTYASRTSLFNIKEKQWDEKILNLFGIDRSKLCDIEEVGQNGHFIQKSILDNYDFSGDIPFISAGGDQQCGAVGLGVIEEEELSLTLGSGGFLLAPTKNFKPTSDLIYNYHSIPDQLLAEGLLVSVASLTNYIQRTFFSDYTDDQFYELISEVIRSDIQTDILHFPHYQGRGTPDWNHFAKGAYFNLTFGSTKEEMLLAVIESICIEIKNNINSMEKILGFSINKIFVAGGLSNNSEFMQLLSDITEINLIKPDNTETTALGALLVGRKSLEDNFTISSYVNTIELETPSQEYYPKISSNHYKNKIIKWNKLYGKLYEIEEEHVNG